MQMMGMFQQMLLKSTKTWTVNNFTTHVVNSFHIPLSVSIVLLLLWKPICTFILSYIHS